MTPAPSCRNSSSWTARYCASVIKPRPMPLWLVTINVRQPASLIFRNAAGTPGIDPDPGRVVAVLDFLHQRAVTVEEYRPGPAHESAQAACSSAAVTVAVPNLPTTSPLAQLASSAASAGEAPAASPRVNTAIAVSPAPDTSNTSFARVGVW